MLRKFIFLTIVFCAITTLGMAQGDASNPSPTAVKEKAEIKEERVEGVFALAGYLGNKLIKELSTRMNLDDAGNSTPAEPTKVIIKVGMFKVERIESR
jgi:hypothetical protein